MTELSALELIETDKVEEQNDVWHGWCHWCQDDAPDTVLCGHTFKTRNSVPAREVPPENQCVVCDELWLLHWATEHAFEDDEND